MKGVKGVKGQAAGSTLDAKPRPKRELLHTRAAACAWPSRWAADPRESFGGGVGGHCGATSCGSQGLGLGFRSPLRPPPHPRQTPQVRPHPPMALLKFSISTSVFFTSVEYTSDPTMGQKGTWGGVRRVGMQAVAGAGLARMYGAGLEALLERMYGAGCSGGRCWSRRLQAAACRCMFPTLRPPQLVWLTKKAGGVCGDGSGRRGAVVDSARMRHACLLTHEMDTCLSKSCKASPAVTSLCVAEPALLHTLVPSSWAMPSASAVLPVPGAPVKSRARPAIFCKQKQQITQGPKGVPAQLKAPGALSSPCMAMQNTMLSGQTSPSA